MVGSDAEVGIDAAEEGDGGLSQGEGEVEDGGIHGDDGADGGKEADQLGQGGLAAVVVVGGQGRFGGGACQNEGAVGQALGEGVSVGRWPGAGGVASFGGEEDSVSEMRKRAGPGDGRADRRSGERAGNTEEAGEFVGAVFGGGESFCEDVEVDGVGGGFGVESDAGAQGGEGVDPFGAGGEADVAAEPAEAVEDGQEEEDVTQAMGSLEGNGPLEECLGGGIGGGGGSGGWGRHRGNIGTAGSEGPVGAGGKGESRARCPRHGGRTDNSEILEALGRVSR